MPKKKIATTRQPKRPAPKTTTRNGRARKTATQTTGKTATLKTRNASRHAQVQAALYRIADAASAVTDMQEFYAAMHRIVRELMYAENFFIVLYDATTNTRRFPYYVDTAGDVPPAPGPVPPQSGLAQMLRTHQSLHLNRQQIEEATRTGMMSGTPAEDFVGVPLLQGDKLIGGIGIQSYIPGVGYTEEDVRILEFVAQHIAIALERARAIEETRQRNAELAIINSIQQGLASQLDFQAIIDLVGDKLRAVFHTGDIGIRWYDAEKNLVHYLYEYEHGQRLSIPPRPPSQTTWQRLVIDRQPLMFNTPAEMIAFGLTTLPDTDQGKSFVTVPIIGSDKVLGAISLEDYDREYAFGESQVRLLSTVASSMGVALENARLFDQTQRLLKETEQRAAELAIINSVQEGLASKLDMQAIYDLVGDKIREIFEAQAVLIGVYDVPAERTFFPYLFEKGKRYQPRIEWFNGLDRHLLATRQLVLINHDVEREIPKYGMTTVEGTEPPRSLVFVPLLVRDQAKGYISLQNIDRADAFSESDVRLLQTLANSMSVALENARLFDETQRLFQQEQQRAAELAIINSVGEAMTKNLDVETVTRIVGDKVREIFKADVTTIYLYDSLANVIRPAYGYDHGYFDPQAFPPLPLGQGLTSEIIRTRQPLLFGTSQESDAHGAMVIPDAQGAEDDTQSYLGVPILVGDPDSPSGQRVLGVVSVQSYKQHAFDENSVRLLSTLSSNMGVAIENARLFEAERQRIAELALINSVQQGLVARLDYQSIIDLVGDKIQEIFNAQVVSIMDYDPETNWRTERYAVERGKHMPLMSPLPARPTKIGQLLATTRQPVILRTEAEIVDYGGFQVPNTESARSALYVPLFVGDVMRGTISLQNLDHENAFSEADARVLQTLAASMSVALENARLFDETQRLLKETEQRAAELGIINSVQEGLASKLDFQGIIDLVGDKIRDIFDAQVVSINLYDRTTNLLSFPYGIERGQRYYDPPRPAGGFSAHVIHTRQPLVINHNIMERSIEFGANVLGSGEVSKSYVGVPIVAGDQVIGVIDLQNLDHEDAFSESDVTLLTTLANSLGVALQNARLFDETERRANEMAALTDIGREISATLELNLVLDRIAVNAQRVLNADTSAVFLLESDGETLRPISVVGNEADAIRSETFRLGEGMIGGITQRGQAEMVHDTTQDPRGIHIPGTQPETEGEQLMVAPLEWQDRVVGALTVWRQHQSRELFTNDDLNFLVGMARQAAIAIQNARLYAASNELLKQSEQRAAELALINSVQQGLASKLDFQGIIELVGEEIRRVIASEDLDIRLIDYENNLVSFPYSIQNGERIENAPIPLGRGFTGHIVRTRQPLMINHDIELRMTEFDSFTLPGTQLDKSFLGVPILSGNQVIGVITLASARENAFTESHLNLLNTLAASMGVALQNARLFDELQNRNREISEALEQQTATSDILRVIAASPSDIQPVLDVVVQHAARLCEVEDVIIFQVDGDALRVAAAVGSLAAPEIGTRIPLRRDMVAGRAVLDHTTVHVDDLAVAANHEFPGSKAYQDKYGQRTTLATPLLREGKAIGAIYVWRDKVRPLSDKQIQLLKTFADQAAIAIENVRLFNETKQRSAELEIINSVQQALSSKLDIQAIYDLVGDKIREIFDAQVVLLTQLNYETETIIRRYVYELGQRVYPPPGPIHEFARRHMQDPRTIVINNNLEERTRELGMITVWDGQPEKSMVMVPLLVGGKLTGSISLSNVERENAFDPAQVRLLETLASSMSVALDNARLFDETQRRARETAALNEIGREISATLDLESVLQQIATRAEQVLNARDVVVRLRQPDGTLPTVVARGKYADVFKKDVLRVGQGMTGSVAQTGIAEIVNDPVHDPRMITVAGTDADEDTEAIIFVPLNVRDQVIGVMTVWRDKAQYGVFTPGDLDFAVGLGRQAAIAIENARLFNEIQRSNQYNEAIVQTSPVAIVTVDNDFRVVSWNPAAETLFGYSAQEAIGRNIYELHSKKSEIREESTRFGDEIAQGKRIRAITQRTRKDGSLVDVEVSGVPVIVEGQRAGNILIYHDITELERARKEAIQANNAKSAFLATMSHEIRTPMNAIIGMSGLLMDTPLNDEQREYADIIRTSGDTLLTIINDILDFSKIEAGKMELDYQPFDLRETVESALDLVAARAADKKLELAYIVEKDVPETIVGDATRLRQILLNLLNNAVKFTEHGEVVLTVTTEDGGRTTGDGSDSVLRPDTSSRTMPIPRNMRDDASQSSVLHFSVRDTGIGITPQQQARLFQSFSQADASTARKYGGTGLGLAISKRLAEIMGGTMWVESRKDEGSTFHFTIRAEASPLVVRARRDLSGAQEALEGKRVLIVDDNATNRRILTMQTRNWGMLARETASPQEALAWLERGDPFDIAILDLHMPEMDGVALGRAIRQLPSQQTHDGAGDGLPLVLFSSLGRREPGSEDVGFAAYLTKPIKPSQLYDALVNILERETVPAAPQGGSVTTQLDPTLSQRLPLRILLAEDNAVNQKLALRLLAQMGYRADVAANGLEVLDALERQPYDVILMDVQMPEMDGLEASRRINAKYPRAARPRIVAMTANAMQGDREMCIAAGMDDYLTKPVRVNELVDALTRVKPTTPRADDAQVIDPATFENLKATMGADFIGELIDTFLEDSPQIIAQMKTALNQNDADSFRRAAHSLKSNSNNFGAFQLAALSKDLEMTAKTGNLNATADKITVLETEFARVRGVLERKRG